MSNNGFLDRTDLKIIRYIILFTLVIIGCIVLQFLHSRTINKEYTNSIGRSTKIINATMVSLTESSAIQRMLLNMAIINDSIDNRKCLDRINLADKRNRLKIQLLKEYFSTNLWNKKTNIDNIERAYIAYWQSSIRFREIINKSPENIPDYIIKDLRPKYRLYQKYQKNLFNYATANYVKESNDINASSNKFGLTLLLIGLFPFIFIVVKIIKIILNPDFKEYKQSEANNFI